MGPGCHAYVYILNGTSLIVALFILMAIQIYYFIIYLFILSGASLVLSVIHFMPGPTAKEENSLPLKQMLHPREAEKARQEGPSHLGKSQQGVTISSPCKSGGKIWRFTRAPQQGFYAYCHDWNTGEFSDPAFSWLTKSLNDMVN